MRVLSFRPGVADSETALESVTHIYKFLEQEYDYKFTIVKFESDTYNDDELDIVEIADNSLKTKIWPFLDYVPKLPVGSLIPERINTLFKESDIVLTVDPTTSPVGVLGIRLAHAADIPVWFDSGRTTMNPRLGLRWSVQRRVISDSLYDVKGIIATSPKVFERFSDLGLYNKNLAEKFTIMGHPTDTDLFSPPEARDSDTIDIVTLSRLVPEKGIYYILEAVTPILRSRNDVRLKLIGEGPMRNAIKTEVKERGISDVVEFLGRVPHQDLPDVYANANIFVNHAVDIDSWEEFFGAANIEAMACGLPCVLSTSGSIPYVIREDGIARLVQQRDIRELRSEIKTLVESETERARMGEAARSFVTREYSVSAISEKYHRMIVDGQSESIS